MRLILLSLGLSGMLLYAEGVQDTNETNLTREERLHKAIDAEIRAEETYAKEQKFYGPDEYDLKAKEIDPASLGDIQLPEPDFTDNYGACDTK